MHTSFVSRRLLTLAFLAALTLFAAPAFADQNDKLNGAWVPDVEKSLDLLIGAGVVDQDKRDEAREGLSTLKVTFDVPGRVIHGELKGKGGITSILEIADNPDGSVHIRTDNHADTLRFVNDDTILAVYSHLMLKRVK